MVLVLGIASLFCCGLIGPIAWIKGNGVTAEIDQSGEGKEHRKLALVGKICGIVGTVIWVLVILGMIVTIIGGTSAETMQ